MRDSLHHSIPDQETLQNVGWKLRLVFRTWLPILPCCTAQWAAAAAKPTLHTKGEERGGRKCDHRKKCGGEITKQLNFSFNPKVRYFTRFSVSVLYSPKTVKHCRIPPPNRCLFRPSVRQTFSVCPISSIVKRGRRRRKGTF